MPTLLEMKSERGEVAQKALNIQAAARQEIRELVDSELAEIRGLVARGERLSEYIRTEESLLSLEEKTYETNRGAVRIQPDGSASPTPSGKRFASMGEQLQAIARASSPGGRVDNRLIEARSLGLNEAIGSEGGFTMQSDFAADVYKLAHETGQVSRRCRPIPIGANFSGTKIPAINESSRVDGSRWGGVVSYWAAEGGTLTPSKPTFRLLDLQLKKLIGLAYATDEMLQDSQLLERIIRQAFAEEIAYKTDDGAYRGVGGGQMLGILNAPALITVAAASGSGVRVLAADILNMWGRCWAPSRSNAVWFLNQDVEQQLYQLTLGTATVNQAVYVPPGGLSAAPYATLMGRPVVPIEQASTLGTVGDIVLADMDAYALADKGQVQDATSMHVAFLTDEQVFRFIYRVEGQPFWQSPLTPAHGSNTLSPFVALAARS
jgi:HK97 family phage major capsid protein